MEVTFDTSGLSDVLLDYQKNFLAYPMEEIGEGMIAAIDDLIDSEGDGKWDPLAASTIEMRPWRDGGKLLQDTGELANIQTLEVTNDSVMVGSPAPYAHFHSSQRPRKKIPLRNFLDINFNIVLDETAEAIMEHIIER